MFSTRCDFYPLPTPTTAAFSRQAILDANAEVAACGLVLDSLCVVWGEPVISPLNNSLIITDPVIIDGGNLLQLASRACCPPAESITTSAKVARHRGNSLIRGLAHQRQWQWDSFLAMSMIVGKLC